jgi:hypothetical protein
VINRTQSLVLGFFAFAWINLLAILLVEPAIHDDAMKLPAGRPPLADLAFLGGISALILLLSVGVLGRWRWTFWLILAAFLVGGALRTPVSVPELAGFIPRPDLRGTSYSRSYSASSRALLASSCSRDTVVRARRGYPESDRGRRSRRCWLWRNG